jgi:N-acetylglucosaminyldiphosphoundecaprenol N-acetyl-beta-D-mannosaminyltransferase
MKIAARERRRKGAEENQATDRLSAGLPHRSKSTAVTITGIPVSNLSEQDTVEVIEALISEGGTHYGAVVNAAKLVAASRDDALRGVLLNADLVTADGMSVVWASRVLGKALKERVAGIDLFERLVERAASKGLAVYFLGAREEAVRATVELFAKRYPALRVAGYRNGYFEASDSRQVCEAIKQTNADLLFVAMGSPRQENWIASNLALTGVRFALGVGGSFDHLGGRARRAPRWMQRSGLEWLHRLAQEPRRLWRRYLFGNSAFIWLVMRERLRGRGPAPQK